MKNIILEIKNTENALTKLNTFLLGNIKTEAGKSVLEIDNEIGKGVIRNITLKGGISFLEYDVTFYEEVKISFNSPSENPIYFAYCSKGYLTQSFGNTGKTRRINEFQTAILSGEENSYNEFYFVKDLHVKTSVIRVDEEFHANTNNVEMLSSQVRKLFNKNEAGEPFVYFGTYNLQIAEQIRQLEAIKQEGLVRVLLTESVVYRILALEIQQHIDDTNNVHNLSSTLTKSELARIKDISDLINEKPEVNYTIKSLCNQCSLSPAKLQEGFKLMHNRTVTDYIRNVRVEAAEELIKNTDLNISEIVYSIGLTSRSYFSKIFKEKYGITPNEFKKQLIIPVAV